MHESCSEQRILSRIMYVLIIILEQTDFTIDWDLLETRIIEANYRDSAIYLVNFHLGKQSYFR